MLLIFMAWGTWTSGKTHMATSSATTTRINVFSTPRTLSTAMMYSFGARPDCVAVDEPLYAHHLKQSPHLQQNRPYVNELFKSQSQDGAEVVAKVILGPIDKPVLYVKHMAKQIINLDLSFISKTKNVLLVRDPVKMLTSWVNKLPASLEETGYIELLKLVEVIREAGQEVLVVDSDDLQRDPEGVLTALCSRLGIPFVKDQLQWKAGPKPFDGVWADFWYDQVHRTSGFNTTDEGPTISESRGLRPFPPQLLPLLRLCSPFYEALRAYAIKPQGRTGLGDISDHGLKHSLAPDRVNLDLLVWVGDRLVPRERAGVSPFDSAVQGGDAVWEGLRVYGGRVFHLDKHLRRLRDSARAMDFKAVPSDEEVQSALLQTLAANNMRDGVHVRLTLSRGLKTTSSMNPLFNVYGCTLIVLAEFKPVGGVATYDNARGIKLITAANRRNPPSCVDSKIHHCNLINNILPKIQANQAGAQDAIMLDLDGFVSETNATNIFMVKCGRLLTPHADHCLPGITRQTIMELAPTLGISVVERRISLAEFHSADEVFTTGTMGELSPVRDIDGRAISEGAGPVTRRLQEAYRQLTDREGFVLPPW